MAVKPGYKQTEVGVIPEEWEATTIGDVASFSGGSQPPRSSFRFSPTNGYTRLIQIRDYKTDDFATFIPEPFVRKKCTADDIMIGRYGPPIFQILRGIDGAYNVALIKASPSLKINREYFFNVLKQDSLFQLIESLSRRSSGQTGVELPALKAFGLPLPPPPEQRAIAGALSDVDALLASLDQLIAKKRDLKQAAMQQLLTGKTRLPGFSGEWEVMRLGEISRLYQPVTISANQFTESGYPVYGANGVVGFFDDFNHDKWQITVTCRGSTCGTVNRTVEKCWITGNAMVVGCDESDAIDKAYLYYALLVQDLSVCITGTGQPQIVRTPLANIALRIPRDAGEQSAIAEVLTDMDAEIAVLEQRREKTCALKLGMMQELLTGKTRLV